MLHEGGGRGGAVFVTFLGQAQFELLNMILRGILSPPAETFLMEKTSTS
jgi:hypothetical protein